MKHDGQWLRVSKHNRTFGLQFQKTTTCLDYYSRGIPLPTLFWSLLTEHPLAGDEAASPADVVKAQPGCAVENLAGVPYAWVWGRRARESRYRLCRRGRRGIAAEGAGQR